MGLDLATVVVVTLLVECLAGILLLGQALLHRRSRAARIWALAFVASILTTVCYLAWTLAPEAWVGNALGNAAFAIGIGCLWLGAASYNGRAMRLRVALVGTAAIVVFVASVFDVRDPWAGTSVLFLTVVALSVAGSVESLRGHLRQRPFAIGLSVVLSVTAAWTLLRLVMILSFGPDSPVFDTWAGSANAGVMTIVLSVIAATSTAVLISEEVELASGRDLAIETLVGEFVDAATYAWITDLMVRRARLSGSEIAILALSMPHLDQIRRAFGPSAAEALERDFRASVLRRTDATVPVAAVAPGCYATALSVHSLGSVEQAARSLHRLVAEDLASSPRSVVPLVGAGLAIGLTGTSLIDEAVAAADRSVASEDATVVLVRLSDPPTS